MTATQDDVQLVLDYIATSQRARDSREDADFEALRGYLADEFEVHAAAAWTDDPWRIAVQSGDAAIERLREPINDGSRLTTETTNAVVAGDEVLVEQKSTLLAEGEPRLSSVCFLFTVDGGRITRIRMYRNDAGLPVD